MLKLILNNAENHVKMRRFYNIAILRAA